MIRVFSIFLGPLDKDQITSDSSRCHHGSKGDVWYLFTENLYGMKFLDVEVSAKRVE